VTVPPFPQMLTFHERPLGLFSLAVSEMARHVFRFLLLVSGRWSPILVFLLVLPVIFLKSVLSKLSTNYLDGFRYRWIFRSAEAPFKTRFTADAEIAEEDSF
jgi:hypothetical protein